MTEIVESGKDTDRRLVKMLIAMILSQGGNKVYNNNGKGIRKAVSTAAQLIKAIRQSTVLGRTQQNRANFNSNQPT